MVKDALCFPLFSTSPNAPPSLTPLVLIHS